MSLRLALGAASFSRSDTSSTPIAQTDTGWLGSCQVRRGEGFVHIVRTVGVCIVADAWRWQAHPRNLRRESACRGVYGGRFPRNPLHAGAGAGWDAPYDLQTSTRVTSPRWPGLLCDFLPSPWFVPPLASSGSRLTRGLERSPSSRAGCTSVRVQSVQRLPHHSVALPRPKLNNAVPFTRHF